MNNLQRQTIQEVLNATRVHERATDKVKGLEDVNEGLAISATKLEVLLEEDACDTAKAKKLAKFLVELEMTGRREIKRLNELANSSRDVAWTNPHRLEVYRLETAIGQIQAARGVAKMAVQDGINPIVALRVWVANNLTSLTVIKTDGNPIHAVLRRLEMENGIKMAVQAVCNVLDVKINL